MRFLEGPEKGKLGAGNCIYFCWENKIPCTGTPHKTTESFVHLDNGISSPSGPCFYNSKIQNIQEGNFNFLHPTDPSYT